MNNKYQKKGYITNQRLSAFLEQFNYITENDVILEIGKGSGVFASMVEGICRYYSVDIDKNTNPDFNFDISDLTQFTLFNNELKKNNIEFTKIYCCQVLEHIPFEKSIDALNNLFSLNPKSIIVSIPDNRPFLRFKLQLQSRDFNLVVTTGKGKQVNIEQHKQHFWELYSKNITEIINSFASNANKFNFQLVNHYRLFDRPYQHFFIFKYSQNSLT